jgi:hypothetical protein
MPCFSETVGRSSSYWSHLCVCVYGRTSALPEPHMESFGVFWIGMPLQGRERISWLRLTVYFFEVNVKGIFFRTSTLSTHGAKSNSPIKCNQPLLYES